MPDRPMQAYFRCGSCGALSPMTANLRDYDPVEYECEHCSGGTWVELEDVLDKDGRRYVSHRPISSGELPDAGELGEPG